MNVQQIIKKGLKEQLFLNEYLVLPDFGGFVLKKTFAHFSAGSTLLLPPGKTISFNSQLKQNDGIMASFVQSELQCDAAQALNHLKDFAAYCLSILNNRGRLNFDEIGFFYLDFENNICFEPQQHSNFLTDSFGLAPVQLTELEAEVVKKTESVFEDRIIRANDIPVEENLKRKSYRNLAIAAVSGVVLLSSLLLFVSNNKISGSLQAAVFGTDSRTLYSPVNYGDLNLKKVIAEKSDYVADANGIATIELDNKTVFVKALETEVQPLVTTSTRALPVSSFKKHEVVLGAFGILANAEKMVSKLKNENISAEIKERNEKGLYIVSGGGFSSREEALNKMMQLKSAYPNAWIKSK